jgi:hypothetical protein
MAVAMAAIAAGAGIIWTHLRRVSPEERERRRRLQVNRHPRTCEGFVSESAETWLHYSYQVSGAEYEASQDVSTLRDFLPADPNLWIGPVNIKYDPKNPANSIALCEQWSGLKKRGS